MSQNDEELRKQLDRYDDDHYGGKHGKGRGKGKGKGKAKGKGKRKASSKSDDIKQNRLSTAPAASDNPKAAQFKRTLKEVYDLIDNCVAEKATAALTSATSAANKAAAAAATTTTTTDAPSSKAKPSVGVTQVGFGNVQFDESEVQTVQIRKKPRVVEPKK